MTTWLENGRGNNGFDVKITPGEADKKGRSKLYISFSQDALMRIVGNDDSKYICVGINENCMLFKSGKRKAGYKVDSVTGKRIIVRICNEKLKKFIGEYNMEFDEKEQAFKITQRASSTWINVEDELPKLGERVIVLMNGSKKATNRICIARYMEPSKNETEWISDDGYEWLGVAAWMPLPEIPVEE